MSIFKIPRIIRNLPQTKENPLSIALSSYLCINFIVKN